MYDATQETGSCSSGSDSDACQQIMCESISREFLFVFKIDTGVLTLGLYTLFVQLNKSHLWETGNSTFKSKSAVKRFREKILNSQITHLTIKFMI